MEKLNKEVLLSMGFSEAPAFFGLETMQKGILQLKKRQDAEIWRMYISSKWVDVKNAELLQMIDKVYNEKGT